MSTIIDFNDHESRLDALEANAGGEFSKVEITTYNQPYTTSNSNIIIGNNSIISFNNYQGTLITGNQSSFSGFITGNAISSANTKITNITSYGNLITGTNPQITRSTTQVNNFYGNCIFPYNTTINDTVSTSFYNYFGGITLFGGASTINNGNFGGPLLLGNKGIINNNIGIGGILISGSDGQYNNTNPNAYFNLLAGNSFTIGNTGVIQKSTWIIARAFNDTDTEIAKIKQRFGTIFIGTNVTNGASYKVYWPNVLNCYAEQQGNIRYGNTMNITDSDGNAIVENGKLLLEDRVKQLEEEIAQLKQLLNN